MNKCLLFLGLIVLSLVGCNEENEEFDCGTITLELSVLETSNATCVLGGSASFSVLNGLEPYEYSINGTSFRTENSFDGLSAGNYTLSVRDENQCTAQLDFEIEEDPGILSVEIQVLQSANGCGGSSGSVLVTASSANQGEVRYNIDGGDYGVISQFDDLSNGDHIVAVIDELGCEDEAIVYIPSDISYSSSVKSIIDLNCAISGCHIAGTSRVDFTVFSNVQTQATNIRTRTQNGVMPPSDSDRSLTDTEIGTIACWVDDGALNN